MSSIQVPIELIGGPKDGLVMVVRPSCRVLVIPKVARSGSESQWTESEYKMRFEGDQPVTNRSGNLVFDYAGER